MNQLLTTFGVNWELLLAQMVNFAILLYVLKRFAYTPLLNMLQRRQNIVRKSMQDARDAKKALSAAEEDAREIHTEARNKALVLLEETDKQGKTLIAAAKEQGGIEKDAILHSAAKEIADMRDKSEQAIKAKAVEHIMSGVKAILRDEVDAAMNNRIIKYLAQTQS